MATNVPAKNFDVKRIVVSTTIETPVNLESTRVIRYIHVHEATKAVNVRISFSPGGTFSADNYFTIWAGTAWEINDITLYSLNTAGTFFYALGEAGQSVTLEVMWAQA
jgi:hypothetical protein